MDQDKSDLKKSKSDVNLGEPGSKSKLEKHNMMRDSSAR